MPPPLPPSFKKNKQTLKNEKTFQMRLKKLYEKMKEENDDDEERDMENLDKSNSQRTGGKKGRKHKKTRKHKKSRKLRRK